jgi:rhamnose utilization protein RhaD (predicted bifunctional aldolase and dehydrogenase)/NAD(P)-dependent dehydrogenase (short-subunit alcohol dehydrogenase family)
MRSTWADRDAEAMVAHYAGLGVPRDLALRVYTTRLLGRDRKLVLHGGGNTSLKTRMLDLNGAQCEVLCVKGSGHDMARIEPSGMPAVRLDPLRKLLARDAVGDDDMVRLMRANLIDPTAPNPSVEVMLHVLLPHKFVDHTHASAVLSLIDQPNARDLCDEVFANRVGHVPYHLPGFGLAKLAAQAFAADPDVQGLVLHKHGLFTFGEDARESYELHVEFVTLAEQRLRQGRKPVIAAARLPQQIAAATDVAPILRGLCSRKDAAVDGAWSRPLVAFRSNEAILDYVNGAELARYSQAGVVTPDHTIRTKNWPLLVPAPDAGSLDDFRRAAGDAVAAFVDNYRDYFARHNVRCSETKRMLDPAPRVILVPGLGLFGLGSSADDARIAADIAESTIEIVTDAERIGRFESISEADMFDCEYWSLEQAKLGIASTLPLAGQIAVITGGGGAIGAATARVFAAAGAEVALLDVNIAAAAEQAKAIGPNALALECDVTQAASVRAAFAAVIAAFGGVDIVVSNAGAAWQGRIGEVDEAVLRESFELNFYGHQRVAQAAVAIMLKQGTGGCLLFNVSKQAVNPGPNFGPYGLPKAATLFLVRQYAVDYGSDGIRANAVNADRIRSGLLTDDFIKERAKARGLTEKDYMSGNLLGREVAAEDVAHAFLHQALQLKTTADVTTVDGGNIAAALR